MSPLRKGKSKAVVSENISEFHQGGTYAHTAEKFGKKKADKQAVAVALNEQRKSGGGNKRWRTISDGQVKKKEF